MCNHFIYLAHWIMAVGFPVYMTLSCRLRSPSVKLGHPIRLPLMVSHWARVKQKENKRKDQRKVLYFIFSRGDEPLSLHSHGVPHSSSPSQRRYAPTWPTLVSRRKAKTAGVASFFSKSTLTWGTLECFHPQALPRLFQIALDCGAQASHLTRRR